MTNDRYPLLAKQPQIFPLSEKVNGHRIWMYRDDPEDFGFGGNKVRFFEYLIPEILKEKPEVLVTSGSMYSNHIRVTAQVAARLGLACELLLTEDKLPEKLFGNTALAKELGANLHSVGHFAALLKIQEFVTQLQNDGKRVFLVPNGGHTPGAVRAYANVITTTLDELEKQSVRPSAIYLPCASGTTQAGVLCGAAKRSIPPVVSFAVANTPARAQKGISKLIRAASEYLCPVANSTISGTTNSAATDTTADSTVTNATVVGTSIDSTVTNTAVIGAAANSTASRAEATVCPAAASTIFDAITSTPVTVLDCGKNDYGHPDEELLALRQKLSDRENITLDPTYNINAFYGMMRHLEQTPRTDDVLYINTGGYTGLS